MLHLSVFEGIVAKLVVQNENLQRHPANQEN